MGLEGGEGREGRGGGCSRQISVDSEITTKIVVEKCSGKKCDRTLKIVHFVVKLL